MDLLLTHDSYPQGAPPELARAVMVCHVDVPSPAISTGGSVWYNTPAQAFYVNIRPDRHTTVGAQLNAGRQW